MEEMNEAKEAQAAETKKKQVPIRMTMKNVEDLSRAMRRAPKLKPNTEISVNRKDVLELLKADIVYLAEKRGYGVKDIIKFVKERGGYSFSAKEISDCLGMASLSPAEEAALTGEDSAPGTPEEEAGGERPAEGDEA